MVKAKQKPKRGFGRPAPGKPPRPAMTVSSKLETDDLFPLTFYKKFRVPFPYTEGIITSNKAGWLSNCLHVTPVKGLLWQEKHM